MRSSQLMTAVWGMVLFCSAVAQEPCDVRQGAAAERADPRARVEIGTLRVCAAPPQDDSVAQTSDVLVWEVGEAVWARKAVFMHPGAVIVARRQDGAWQVVRQLGSPEPAAYGAFGAQLASDGRWLAVLAKRPQSVWVFDLNRSDDAGSEIRAVRGFAQSVAMLGNRLVVGGGGEARIFAPETAWRLAERVAAPPGVSNAFGGQIAAQGDLLVSTVSGANHGDAGVLPGRVDVYRRDGQSGWRWEARLAPLPEVGAFGQDCCVALDRGRVLVTAAGQRWRFAHDGGGWRPLAGAMP